MKRIAFIYPGQGAQKCGMGKECYETYETFKTFFDEADEILDFDLKEICFTENPLIDQTAHTQPAMVAVCLGITKVLRERGLRPSMTAGLSLGEYAAVSAAGGLKALDAVKLVRERGKLMQTAMPDGAGAMSAVLGLSEESVLAVVNEMDHVSVANYNCPGQIVITGKTEDVAEAGKKLKESGARRVLPLKVSGAFHSKFMKDAGEKLAEIIKEVSIEKTVIPYAANVTAELVTEKEDIAANFCKGISSSVRWEQSMKTMLAAGINVFVEIGPGRTLAGFLKKIDPEVKVYSVGEPTELEKVLAELIG
ncbi:MAG: ACP S-malonyltransferase [Eubacteriales bacterium]|nr:ACP S-malonyltransferase [Eubacteriales bacterium]